MSWMIISLSILSTMLVVALLMTVDGRTPQPTRVSRQPKPAARKGQAGSRIHSGGPQPDRQIFSMF